MLPCHEDDKFMRILPNVTVLLIAVVMAACSTVRIMNVDQAAVTNASGKSLSAEQVRGAIIRAGTALGWQMKDDGPGKLTGMLYLRDHTAVVDIPYSTSSYSIIFKSSVNLKQSGDQIHRNYNSWIQNLNRDIGVQVSAS